MNGTLLHHAAASNKIQMVTSLLDASANPESVDEAGHYGDMAEGGVGAKPGAALPINQSVMLDSIVIRN